MVPDLRRLVHSIEAMMQLPYMILLARLSKSGGLFHVLLFFFWEDAIKKGSFDVILLKAPVIDSSNV